MLAPYILNVGVGIEQTKASEVKKYISPIVIHWKTILCPVQTKPFHYPITLLFYMEMEYNGRAAQTM